MQSQCLWRMPSNPYIGLSLSRNYGGPWCSTKRENGWEAWVSQGNTMVWIYHQSLFNLRLPQPLHNPLRNSNMSQHSVNPRRQPDSDSRCGWKTLLSSEGRQSSTHLEWPQPSGFDIVVGLQLILYTLLSSTDPFDSRPLYYDFPISATCCSSNAKTNHLPRLNKMGTEICFIVGEWGEGQAVPGRIPRRILEYVTYWQRISGKVITYIYRRDSTVTEALPGHIKLGSDHEYLDWTLGSSRLSSHCVLNTQDIHLGARHPWIKTHGILNGVNMSETKGKQASWTTRNTTPHETVSNRNRVFIS